MIFYNQEDQLISARLTFQPANILTLPSTVELTNVWAVSGSGIGIGSQATKSALGEFYERHHFYTDVTPDLTGCLSEVLNNEEVSKFIGAFIQTSEKTFTSSQLNAHQYNLSQVLRISDLSTCHIPTACITLSETRTKTENSIYPLRDTCGCAFGWSPEQTLLGSIKELLERQFLTKFWLTKICIEIIDVSTILTAVAGTCAETLCKALSSSGELSFIDISDSGYPGVCILAVYGQHRADHNVKYCSGMSYAATKELAVVKSILELWQTFRFIDLFIATEQSIQSIADPYLRYFLYCNNYKTYSEIISVYERAQTLSHRIGTPLSLNSLKECFLNYNVDGYIYIKMIPIGKGYGFCSKFISPDFFMHMNNSKNINLKNLYSSSFLHEIQSSRKKQMVPFP